MTKLKVLELFAGIGGFSVGLEKTGGFETVAFVEKDEYCQQVLKKNYPDIKVYNDVTNFKYKGHVDMVTAGFPCQDVSLAGDGAGLSGDRSGLFWYILRTACMVGRPKLLLENVAALLIRGLSTVLGALASFGYDAEWHCIPASYVGAWHRRDRIWILAHSNSIKSEGCSQKQILGQSDLSRKSSRSFEEWQGRSNLPSSRFCGANDGIQNRSHRIGSVGNAVVPQIPEIIGNAILESERQYDR
jgi:DNA (cytosine-5)-methyltransferase 1